MEALLETLPDVNKRVVDANLRGLKGADSDMNAIYRTIIEDRTVNGGTEVHAENDSSAPSTRDEGNTLTSAHVDRMSQSKTESCWCGAMDDGSQMY